MSNNTKIEVKCDGLELIDRRLINPLQGNLKSLDQKNYDALKKSLYTEGFRIPIFVWLEVASQKLYCLDGHQRLFTLNKMTTEGYTVPDKLPIVRIEADSIDHAKQILLKITSQYGKMDNEGVYEFLKTLSPDVNVDLLLEQTALPGIDQEELKDGYLQDPIEADGASSNQPPAFVRVEVDVHNEDYPHYLRQLSELNAKFPRTRVITDKD